MREQWDNRKRDNTPITGCPFCQTAAGRWGCSKHSPNAPNVYGSEQTINLYPGDGMGGEVKPEEQKWKEKFIKSWLELYRYHEVYPWVEGKDIAEQFYLQGRKDEQEVKQEDDIILELAFKDGKFSGIIVGSHLIEKGEVIEFIKKGQEEIDRIQRHANNLGEKVTSQTINMNQILIQNHKNWYNSII